MYFCHNHDLINSYNDKNKEKLSYKKKSEISANSLQESFAKISELMGDDFKRRVLEADGTPRSLINIYINGKNAKFSSGMETELHDGDDVYILPAVAGGSEDLSKKELDKFSRQVMLEEIGYNGQLKLKNAKICVVGVEERVRSYGYTDDGKDIDGYYLVTDNYTLYYNTNEQFIKMEALIQVPQKVA